MIQELDSYPSQLTLDVQWGDMDALGHVNNTVPVRWYECSRINFMEANGIGRDMDERGLGPILASINCSYRRQLHYPDSVVIGCRASRIGRSSITLHHVVFSKKLDEIAADGESVIVTFDYQNQRAVRVPDEIRERLAKLHPDIA